MWFCSLSFFFSKYDPAPAPYVCVSLVFLPLFTRAAFLLPFKTQAYFPSPNNERYVSILATVTFSHDTGSDISTKSITEKKIL